MSIEDVDELDAAADALLNELTGGPKEESKDTPPEANKGMNQEEEEGQKPDPSEESANSNDGRHTDDQKTEPQKSLDGVTIEQMAERLANAEERYKNVQAAMTKGTQEAAGLRKENEELRSEIKKLEAQIELLGKQEPKKEEPTKPDALDQFATDYDEQRPVVDKLKSHDEAVGKVSSEVEALKGELEAEREARLKAEGARKKKVHNATILKAHPDAFDLAETGDFQGWLSRNDEFVPVVKEGTADQIIRMLNRYKSDVGVTGASNSNEQTTDDREAQLLEDAKKAAEPDVSSVQTTPGNGRTMTMKQYSAMLESLSPEEYMERQDEMDALYLEVVKAA